MPRHTRHDLAGTIHHVTVRSHDGKPCFMQDLDYALYLELLERFLPESGCELHAYALMTNHVHLVLSTARDLGIGKLMMKLSGTYSRISNRLYGRAGSRWIGRHGSKLIKDESYLRACYLYVDANPLRAGLVDVAPDYAWSSCAYNCGRRDSPIVSKHDWYLGLGSTSAAQAKVYEELLAISVEGGMYKGASNGTW